MSQASPPKHVPKWGRFEHFLESRASYANPYQDVDLKVVFTAPSGKRRTVDAFWDGGNVWRVRFSPNEAGQWHFRTECTNAGDLGLNRVMGAFVCGSPEGSTRFQKHGPIRLSQDRRYFVHDDGTPFFWMADTAWNGPLRSSSDDWEHYLSVRGSQGFNAVQWVTTQWRAASTGDANGEWAFTGEDRITVNPSFFQRMDERVDAMSRAGFLSVPVLLWAHKGNRDESNRLNPGFSLSEEEAGRLCRYMVARWGANPSAWILAGDVVYEGETTERWKRIGHAVFGGRDHAPVTVHPVSVHWTEAQFGDEAWFDFIGYQSGHGDNDEYIRWLVEGPPAQARQHSLERPVINLEPPYENHIAYHSQQPFDADSTRRRLYWSLLNAPTAGVTYGGHGVWGWDDGTQPTEDHQGAGIPLPWKEALTMPGAEQICHLTSLFGSVEWWRLRPAQEILAAQLGTSDIRAFVSASRTESHDLALVYTPGAACIQLRSESLRDDVSALWFDPRHGQWHSAPLQFKNGLYLAETPAPGDWVLLLGKNVSLPANHGEQA